MAVALLLSCYLLGTLSGLLPTRASAMGCTVSWAVDADGFWDDPANWDTGSVPGYNDDVCIDRPAGAFTITIRQSAGTVGSVQSAEMLRIVTNGLLKVRSSSSLSGGMKLEGGTLETQSYSTLTISGNSLWSEGSLTGNGIITNTGTLTLTNPVTRTLSTRLDNTNTIIHGEGGNLKIGSAGRVNNLAGALYDFQGDGDIIGYGKFYNTGTLRKSAGSGESRFSSNIYLNNLDGTIEVLTGQLTWGRGTSTGGTFNVSAGAILDLTGGSNYTTYEGTYTGSGDGRIQISSGRFNTTGNGVTFNFPGDLFHWTGGQIAAAATRPFTNTATLTLSGSETKTLYGQSIITNAGTIVHAGSGNLKIGSTGQVNNPAGALYDFQGDGDIIGYGKFYNAGTLRKSAGSGESRFSSNIYLNNLDGTIEVLTGQLTWGRGTSTGGTFNVSASAVLDLTGGSNYTTYEGTYTGSGDGRIELASGRLNTGSTETVFNFPPNLFHWTGGTMANGGSPLRNIGYVTISGPDTKFLKGMTINNEGTIIQTDTNVIDYAPLGVTSTLNNLPGALFEIQGDFNPTSALGFNNEGTFRKTGSAGELVWNGAFEHSGGVIEVKKGTLTLKQTPGNSTGATFKIDAGALLNIIGASSARYTGTYTGSGGGVVQLSGVFTAGADGATLNFPDGMFFWTNGAINLGGSGVGEITNLGTISLIGADVKDLYGTLNNRGTIKHSGTGYLDFSGGTGVGTTLNNEIGAIYDFQGDVSIVGYGNFNNWGTLRKSAGATESLIVDVRFNSLRGLVQVQSGKLGFDGGGDSTGGRFEIDAGSVLEITNDNWARAFKMSGTYTGSGDGTLKLTGRLDGDDDDPPILDFPNGFFQWIEGTIFGPMINAGTITIAGDQSRLFRGQLTNRGSIIHSGSGNLRIWALSEINNEGLYDLQSDADLVLAYEVTKPTMINNSGTFRKSGGSGTSETVGVGVFGDLVFNNTGIVEVQSGTLSFPEPVTQMDNSILTGGTWRISDGATLNIPSSGNIITNQGDVTLIGPNSEFPNINSLQNNEGSFSILDGRDFSTVGNFTNTGQLTVGAGSTLTVNGEFSKAGFNTINFEIADRPATGQFGQINTTGRANIEGTMRIILAEGFGPTLGDTYQIMSFTGRDGGTPVIAGLTPFFEANVTNTHVTLNTIATATDITVDGDTITFPSPATPGQDITISYTARNLEDIEVTGDWTDSVYISRDETLSEDDKLLGRVQHTGGIRGLGQYTEQLTAPLPGVVDGRYHIIVVADSRGQAPDTDRSNNTVASTSRIQVDIPGLEFGVPTAGTIAEGQDIYYRLDVPASGDVTLTANFTQLAQAELHMSYLTIPDRSNAHSTAFDPSKSLQEIVLASPPAGSYYVLLHGREGAADGQAYTITANHVAFALKSINPNSGSNTGEVTSKLIGAGFSANTRAFLTDPAGDNVSIGETRFVDPNTLFVTFSLVSADPGVYDVRVVDGDKTAILNDSFTITAGQPGKIKIQVTTPDFLRFRRVNAEPIRVEYSNIGEGDLEAPLLLITADNAVLAIRDETSLSDPDVPEPPKVIGKFPSPRAGRRRTGRYVTVVKRVRLPEDFDGSAIMYLGINHDGLAGVLPPGAGGRVTFEFLPSGTTRVNAMVIDLDKTIDWDAQKDKLRPMMIPDDAWDAIFAVFKEQVGSTMADLQRALAKDASYLSQLGIYTSNVDRLLAFEVRKAGGFGTITRRYRLGALGRGWTDPTDFQAVTDGSGNVTIRILGNIRYFAEHGDGSFRGQQGEFGTLTREGDSLRLREPNGMVTVFRPDGKLDFIEDPNGNRITANYTGDFLTSYSNSFGDTFSFTYNDDGRIIEQTDPVGRATTFTYDDTGEHLLNISTPRGSFAFTYVTGQGAAREHALESITFPDGTYLYMQYDERGRLIRQSRQGGAEAWHYGYDAGGGIWVTNMNNELYIFMRNEFGQVARIYDPLGAVVQISYNSDGLPTKFTDAHGNAVFFSYDDLANLSQIMDPLGQIIDMTFEPVFNQLAALQDPRGNTTSHTYDDNGNLTQIEYPDGSVEQFGYDLVGNMTSFINRRGQEITFEYNQQNLLTRKVFPDGSAVEFTYDDHRNLISAAQITDAGTQTTRFDYDAADRLTAVHYPNGRALFFFYDDLGRRERMVDQDGFTVNYEYNDLGRLAKLTDGNGELIVSYSYDNMGRLERKDNGNGTFTVYDYDGAGNLSSVVNHAPDASVLSRFDYTYDPPGRPTSMTTLDGTFTYGYDAAGQLISVTTPSGRTVSYEYDAAGNRIAVNDDGVITDYSANELSQYTTVGAATFTYDADGNLASMTDDTGTITYTHDVENRLISIVSPTDTWTFEYDAFRNRTAVIHNGQRTEYLIDPFGLGDVVGEYDGASNLVAHYVHGLGLASRVDSTGTAAFYDFDRNGNTAELTGPAGSVLNSYAYMPFGEKLKDIETTANPFTFVGEFGVMDNVEGLYFMRSRWYVSNLGRFVQQDPLAFANGDTNLYRYVWNNPIVLMDPTGLQAEWLGGVVGNLVFDTVTGQWIQATASNLQTLGAQYLASEKAAEIQLGRTMAPLLEETLTTIGYRLETGVALETGAVVATGSVFNVALLPGLLIGVPMGLGLNYLIEHQMGPWWLEPMIINPNLVYSFSWLLYWTGLIPSPWSGDPNYITGPAGFGTEGFITSNRIFDYVIHFENMPEATAPAQEIIITLQLDPDLDWTTFELGDFGFGDFFVDVPEGRNFYETLVDARDTLGLYIDFQAGIDLDTGLVTWRLQSIDPVTFDFTGDPLAGILPPNINPPEGEGFVRYSVIPKADLPTGTQIDAMATIVFDFNPPIDTNTHRNTIDADAPTSSVDPLPATSGPVFPVTWSGDDGAGSGIAFYDVYVSEDGGPFVAWQTGITATTAIFTGTLGHTYAFYSVATDHVGYRQPTPSAAQATTTASCLDLTGDRQITILDIQAVAEAWHRSPGAPFDLDNDGQVTARDILLVAARFSESCP